MVCMGLKPGAAGWKVQTNPLSYGSIPMLQFVYDITSRTYLQYLVTPILVAYVGTSVNRCCNLKSPKFPKLAQIVTKAVFT